MGSKRLVRRGVVAVVGVAGVIVGMVVASAGQSPAPVASAGSTGAAAPTTTAATSGVPTTIPAPNPRGLSGWGTAQPNAMAATVMGGRSWTHMSADERKKVADDLVHVRKVALEIGTVKHALELGYVPNFQYVDGRGYEFIKWSNITDKLDLDRPSMVNFPDKDPDTGIASVAYQVLGTKEAGPPDFHPEVFPWHYHSLLCLKNGSIMGSVEYDPAGKIYKTQAERCENAGAEYQPQLNHWMVDLWVVPGWENPWGLVSSKHPDLIRTPTPWFSSTNVAGPDASVHH